MIKELSNSNGEPLIFEAYTSHNGYYLHDFSFGHIEEKGEVK